MLSRRAVQVVLLLFACQCASPRHPDCVRYAKALESCYAVYDESNPAPDTAEETYFGAERCPDRLSKVEAARYVCMGDAWKFADCETLEGVFDAVDSAAQCTGDEP